MGYTVTIGELEHDVPEYDEYAFSYMYGASVKRVIQTDAPEGSNSRSPSYFVWNKVCLDLNIKELLYYRKNDRGNPVHKNVIFLNDEFLTAFKEAARLFRLNNPSIVPKYTDDTPDTTKEELRTMELCGSMMRLVWMEYWFDWAVKKYKNPVMLTR